MRPGSVWLLGAVLGAAAGLGTLVFGLLVLLALIPIAIFFLATPARMLGLGGLCIGFGGAWSLSVVTAGQACVADQGCAQPSNFVAAAIGIFLIGLGVTAIALVRSRRANSGDLPTDQRSMEAK